MSNVTRLARRWIASKIIEDLQLDGPERDQVIEQAYRGEHDCHPQADEILDRAVHQLNCMGHGTRDNPK